MSLMWDVVVMSKRQRMKQVGLHTFPEPSVGEHPAE
jgi:hypothetical protein